MKRIESHKNTIPRQCSDRTVAYSENKLKRWERKWAFWQVSVLDTGGRGVKALSGGNLFTKQTKNIRQTAISCFPWRPLNLLGRAVVCDNALYLGETGMDKHAFSPRRLIQMIFVNNVSQLHTSFDKWYIILFIPIRFRTHESKTQLCLKARVL